MMSSISLKNTPEPETSINDARLTVNTPIKIFTASGHLVKSFPASDSSATGDLTNDSGDKVSSGMYLYLLVTDQGEKKTGSLVIIK